MAPVPAQPGRLGPLAREGSGPVPGSLLPEHRIVAFYGNPEVHADGHPGQIPPEEMLPKLERTATEWAKADPGGR